MKTQSGLNRSKEKERKKERQINEFFGRLSVLVPGLSSPQDPSQAMVDSNSHTEADGSAGDPWPSLQTHPWKHQRNLPHDEGSHGHAQNYMPRHTSFSPSSHSLMDQDLWEELSAVPWFSGSVGDHRT
ncbi:hypothetical protein ACE6H2_026091 [Prunus campanulata]